MATKKAQEFTVKGTLQTEVSPHNTVRNHKLMPEASRNVLIVCATVMFLSVIGAIVTIDRYVSGDNALTLAGIMVTLLGATITGLAALFKVDGLKGQVATVNDKADAMLNGELTKKIQAEVLPLIRSTLQSELATLLVQHSIIEHPDKRKR